MYFSVLCLLTGVLPLFLGFLGSYKAPYIFPLHVKVCYFVSDLAFFYWPEIIPRESLGVDIHVSVCCEGDNVPAQDAPQRRAVGCPPRRPERTRELDWRRMDGRPHRCRRRGCKPGPSHHPNRDTKMPLYIVVSVFRQDHRCFPPGIGGFPPFGCPHAPIKPLPPPPHWIIQRHQGTQRSSVRAVPPISARGACGQQADPTGARGER